MRLAYLEKIDPAVLGIGRTEVEDVLRDGAVQVAGDVFFSYRRRKALQPQQQPEYHSPMTS